MAALINRYPLWKYLLIIFGISGFLGVLIGFIYSVVAHIDFLDASIAVGNIVSQFSTIISLLSAYFFIYLLKNSKIGLHEKNILAVLLIDTVFFLSLSTIIYLLLPSTFLFGIEEVIRTILKTIVGFIFSALIIYVFVHFLLNFRFILLKNYPILFFSLCLAFINQFLFSNSFFDSSPQYFQLPQLADFFPFFVTHLIVIVNQALFIVIVLIYLINRKLKLNKYIYGIIALRFSVLLLSATSSDSFQSVFSFVFLYGSIYLVSYYLLQKVKP